MCISLTCLPVGASSVISHALYKSLKLNQQYNSVVMLPASFRQTVKIDKCDYMQACCSEKQLPQGREGLRCCLTGSHGKQKVLEASS